MRDCGSFLSRTFYPFGPDSADAAAGSGAIAVMAKVGHASMTTTKRYLHLAGVVFRDEAVALERRLLGTTTE